MNTTLISNEPYDTLYRTCLGFTVAVCPSDAMFYESLIDLKKKGVITQSMHEAYEILFYVKGYKLNA